MGKGELTRQAILDRAIQLAAQVGLEGVTIGRLADELSLSKSGLFAHFRSKETLQVQMIEAAAARFVDRVVRPALKAPRGEPRVRAFFERWLEWGTGDPAESGCFFVAASAELDDQPGVAREALVRAQKDWLDTLSGAARIAMREGHFRADLDPDAFAFAVHGVMLSAHHATRLLNDARASAHAHAAFEIIVRDARAPNAQSVA